MDRKTAFDLAKKIIEGGDIDQGYLVEGNPEPYKAYQTNEDWESFLKEMKEDYPNAHGRYKECPGGEIERHYNSRWGKWMPPKMASYASSSRFIYETCRKNPDFVFEEELPIGVQGVGKEGETVASLDGYLPSKRIYVEAKCHEFYSHSATEFKEKYREYYEFLAANCKQFGYDVRKKNNEKDEYTVVFSFDGNEFKQLDVKQILCHFLGIAKKNLQDREFRESTLLYLVYKPTQELLLIVANRWGEKKRKSIEKCWEIEAKEASNEEFFKELYYWTVLYQAKALGIGPETPEERQRIAESFSFKFCDQNTCKSELDLEE